MDKARMRVLTVRVNDEKEREAIRYVMSQSGCKRAAQAMIFACSAYKIMHERETPVIRELKEKHTQHSKQQQRVINSLMEENERLRRCIHKMNGTIDDFKKSMTEIQDLIVKKQK